MRRAALKNDGRATNHGLSLGECHTPRAFRRRSCSPPLPPRTGTPSLVCECPARRAFRYIAREFTACHARMSRGNPPGYDVQRFWRAMSAEKQTRRCAARVGKLLDLRPVGAGCRESGQLSLRCSPWNFILASAARTGAKQSALTPNHRQWADTTAISLRARLRCSPCCPCRTSPDAPPDGRGVSIDGRAQTRRARTNPRPRELKFGSAGGLSCRMLPGSRTRDVICKAAPF